MSHHCVESDIVGTYTGCERKRTESMCFDFRLVLKEDGTCEFNQYIDIYKIVGYGRWKMQNDYIIIKYEDLPADINSALMAGCYMKGTDIIKIYRKNKLNYNGSILKRCNVGNIVKECNILYHVNEGNGTGDTLNEGLNKVSISIQMENF